MRVLSWSLVLMLAAAGCVSQPPEEVEAASVEVIEAFEPHVIVAVPDSGINPYHALYHRPDRVDHPCTYVRDFPCDIPALNLTLGGDDWEAAFEADEATWAAVEPDTWYWIPGTVFVAVSCDAQTGEDDENFCVLDDNGMHGTGTTSSIIMENPDALLAFREGGPSVEPFVDAGIPVDVFSVSWGYIVPIPVPSAPVTLVQTLITPLYVKSAGNDPWSTMLDRWAGDTDVISVGGAYAADRTEESSASKQPDVVSYYCRPTAQTEETHELRESYCGTSFAAPTVAGALSKVILTIRRATGYDGATIEGVIDPIHGLTIPALRDAMNRTATYDPEAKYENTDPVAGVPLNPVAPWTQWGWGFYDGDVANATIADLMGETTAAVKPAMAATYMHAIHEAKQTLYS